MKLDEGKKEFFRRERGGRRWQEVNEGEGSKGVGMECSGSDEGI